MKYFYYFRRIEKIFIVILSCLFIFGNQITSAELYFLAPPTNITPIVLYPSQAIDVFRSFGKTGLKFHLLGLGTIWFGRRWLPNNDAYEYPKAEEIEQCFDIAFQQIINEDGILFLDTAASYGLSEQRIGEYFRSRPGTREKTFICTKWGEWFNVENERSIIDFSKENLIRSIERSSAHLGRFDLLYFHMPGNRTEYLEVFKDRRVMDELERIKKENRHGIKYLGDVTPKNCTS